MFVCIQCSVIEYLIGRVVRQLELKESIRYAENDAVERWLYDLLCLNVTELPPVLHVMPSLDQCDLFYVNRDTLFSYNPVAELFLKHLVNIYVSSHYKVSIHCSNKFN